LAAPPAIRCRKAAGRGLQVAIIRIRAWNGRRIRRVLREIMNPFVFCRTAAACRIAVFCAGSFAFACADAAQVFAVNQPWVAPASAGKSTEAYMSLSSSEPAVVLHVQSDVADDVSLRGPTATEKPLAALPLAARVPRLLAPGGYRIVLHKLTRSLALGDRVALVLTVRIGQGALQEIAVDAEVRQRSPYDDETGEHHHAH
jgi:copper(I)-binding protein